MHWMTLSTFERLGQGMSPALDWKQNFNRLFAMNNNLIVIESAPKFCIYNLAMVCCPMLSAGFSMSSG